MTPDSLDQELNGALQAWLRQHLSALLAVPENAIDPSTRFDRYGLDSAALVGMTGELADWLGCDIDPAAPYEHASVDALASALARQDAVRCAYAERQRRGGQRANAASEGVA